LSHHVGVVDVVVAGVGVAVADVVNFDAVVVLQSN